MKQPILIFLVSLFALTLFPEMAQGQAREEMLRAIRTTGASIESLECEFTQTKIVSMLEQKMVSGGKLYFRKPSAVRWEYLTPVHNFFIMNGEDLLAGNDASAKHSSLKKNRSARMISSLIVGSLSGESLEDSRNFKAELSAEAGEWVAVLTPLRRDLSQICSSIVLRFNPKTALANSITLNEASGDCTHIVFKNMKINLPLPEGVFDAAAE